MLRALLVGPFFITMTPLLISIQWLLEKLHLPGWGFIACNYYRMLRALLRIHLYISSAPARGRAVLFICNHISWVDIVVIGSIAPVAFVAKSEVRRWPLIGVTAKMQRTVFVERDRRQKIAETAGEIVERLKGGTSVVLFAEGTSSDGNRVLPFSSALIGAVREAAALAESDIMLQPMSICYIGQYGIAMGRRHRPLVAWYGDLDFMPHIKAFIRHGVVDAAVSYGTPLPANGAADRKVMTLQLERTVRAMTAASLRGRVLGVGATG